MNNQEHILRPVIQQASPVRHDDDLDCARGISGCVVAGVLFWVALGLMWVAFKAARVYW